MDRRTDKAATAADDIETDSERGSDSIAANSAGGFMESNARKRPGTRDRHRPRGR